MASQWQHARSTENMYARALRRVAAAIDHIVRAWPPGDPSADSAIRAALRQYSDLLRPWATAVGGRMVADVERQNARTWRLVAEEIGRGVADQVRSTDVGGRMRELLGQQVRLITSLPIDAGQRVHELTLRGLEGGERARGIAREILRTGEVTSSRATLIARTEVGRTASVLTQARAERVGSTGYIWRSARDTDVRPSHRAMEGKFVAWSDPPTLDGMTGHAGCLPNCRCHPEPVIPE